MKIAVFGAGGIGGYFGARLAQTGAEVHLIARGQHLAALKRDGLKLTSPRGDVTLSLPATDAPQEIGASDIVLFCVKATETLSAAEHLGPLLGENTAVITLQNGVDNEDTLSSTIGAQHVVGGVAYILSTIEEPGAIVHQGSLARIVFGELTGAASPRLERFLSVCERGGIDAELATDIRVELWRKYAMICATAGMTAAVRLPIGEIRASEAAFGLYQRLVEEAVAVGRAVGVDLPPDTTERIMSIASELPGEWYSSLHYDLTHAKPMELEALHGTLTRSAREHRVEAPASEAIYGVLSPWALRNKASK